MCQRMHEPVRATRLGAFALRQGSVRVNGQVVTDPPQVRADEGQELTVDVEEGRRQP